MSDFRAFVRTTEHTEHTEGEKISRPPCAGWVSLIQSSPGSSPFRGVRVFCGEFSGFGFKRAEAEDTYELPTSCKRRAVARRDLRGPTHGFGNSSRGRSLRKAGKRSDSAIPKGLCPLTLGCEETCYLVAAVGIFNPNEVRQISATEPQPRWGSLPLPNIPRAARSSQPSALARGQSNWPGGTV